MLYVLSRRPVSPYFTLSQALWWVAYRYYVSCWLYADKDIIEQLFENSFAGPDFLDDNDPEVKLLKEAGFNWLEDPPELVTLRRADFDKWSDEAKAIHEAFVDEFDSTRQYCLAPYKSALFIKLRNGDIPAYGYIAEKLKKGSKPANWQKDDCWEETEDDSYLKSGGLFPEDIRGVISGKTVKGFQKIPAEFWNLEGICWISSRARSHLGSFDWIFVPAKELFAHFPHPAGNVVSIEERAGCLIYDDKGADAGTVPYTESRRGRPALNWPEFHAEIVQYILKNGGLPKKQTALEHYMHTWCLENWGNAPGTSTLRGQISPHYARMKKGKKSD